MNERYSQSYRKVKKYENRGDPTLNDKINSAQSNVRFEAGSIMKKKFE